MKRLSISILAIIAIAFTACDKESSGTEFEFSNSLPPYVTLTDSYEEDTVEVVPGDEIPVTFTVRTGLSKAVTITYNVTGGFQLANQTVELDKYTLSTESVVTVPSTGLNDGDIAEINLVSAAKSDGSALTVGRYNDPALEKIVLRVSLP